jgi:hypothetical protein
LNGVEYGVIPVVNVPTFFKKNRQLRRRDVFDACNVL